MEGDRRLCLSHQILLLRDNLIRSRHLANLERGVRRARNIQPIRCCGLREYAHSLSDLNGMPLEMGAVFR